jgi:hypothetical protein
LQVLQCAFQPQPDTLEIADAIVGRVLKGSRIDLIDCPGLPPDVRRAATRETSSGTLGQFDAIARSNPGVLTINRVTASNVSALFKSDRFNRHLTKFGLNETPARMRRSLSGRL